MNLYIESQLIGLTVSGVGALVIWRYYRDKTCRSAERYSTFGPRFWSG